MKNSFELRSFQIPSFSRLYKLCLLLAVHARTVILTTAILSHFLVQAQITPGAVTREYSWTTAEDADELFLRVGGRFDYRQQLDKLGASQVIDGSLYFPPVDLELADSAVLILEKVLSHEDTKGLTIIVNETLISVDPPAHLPSPFSDYMHHYYPRIAVPLDQLSSEQNNYFSLEVDSVQRWGWPQHVLYGLTLIIYYQPAKYQHKFALVDVTAVADTMIRFHLPQGVNDSLRDLSIITYHLDYDWRGEGRALGWKFNRFRSEIVNHVGAFGGRDEVLWNTSWVPEQSQPISYVLRAETTDGLIVYSQNMQVSLNDRHFAIKLYMPTEIPKNWVTRSGVFTEQVIVDAVSNISEFQLGFTTWSPCYLNGIYLNDHLLFVREGDCYTYQNHRLNFTQVSFLQPGENLIKTGMTPLYNGQMVHGAEIQYPGIMLKVRSEKK